MGEFQIKRAGDNSQAVQGPQNITVSQPDPYACPKSGYIEVTPYIKELAEKINIQPGERPLSVFDKVIYYIRREYGASDNKAELKKLFDHSVGQGNRDPLSIEETDELILRVVNDEVSDFDYGLIFDLYITANNQFDGLRGRYESNMAEYDRITADLLAISDYDPMDVSCGAGVKNYIRGSKDPILVKEVLAYLTCLERLKNLELMLKGDLSNSEKCDLSKAVGHPLTQNYWRLDESLLFTPEARVDGAYKQYVNNHDHPFSFTADELLRYKIASGCTHSAIMFMSLLKALEYEDVRLVSAINNYSYNHVYCKDGAKSDPQIRYSVDSHKVVLATVDDRYVIINASTYPLEVVEFTNDGKPIDPATLIGRDLSFPSIRKAIGEKGSLFRVRAVGEDNQDYLHHCTLENDARVLMTGRYDISEVDCHEYPLPE